MVAILDARRRLGRVFRDLWVGFGPGEREFESSMTIGPFTTSGKGDELIGRLLFGGLGLVTGLGTPWLAISPPGQLLGIWQVQRRKDDVGNPGDEERR